FSLVKGNFIPKLQLLILSRSAREQLRILALHLVFSFLSKFWSSSGVPMNSYNRNPTSFKLLDLTVHNFNSSTRGMCHECLQVLAVDAIDKQQDLLARYSRTVLHISVKAFFFYRNVPRKATL
ncbi:hypothetical protein Tco_0299680, partial [Tanacetum coccineum]